METEYLTASLASASDASRQTSVCGNSLESSFDQDLANTLIVILVMDDGSTSLLVAQKRLADPEWKVRGLKAVF